MNAVLYAMGCAKIVLESYHAVLQAQKTTLRPGVNKQAQQLQQSRLPAAGRSTPVCRFIYLPISSSCMHCRRSGP